MPTPSAIADLAMRLLPDFARLLVVVASILALAASQSVAQPANDAKPASPATPTALPSLSKPTPDDIKRWITDLSHDSYSVRQNAGTQLLTAGMTARGPLVDLANGPDPETRAAARRLIALIDRSEFRRRLDAFAADVDGKQNLTLPGWDEFKKLVGGDAAARSLFVDMQRQEGALIAAVFGGSKRAPEELWEARLYRTAQWQPGVPERSNIPPVGSCATMLFLGSQADMDVSDSAAQLIESIIQRPPLNQLLKDNSQPAVRKLVITWLTICPNKSEEILRQRLSVIAQANLTEALPLAVDVCSGDPQYLHVQPLTKALAAMILGQLGTREHVAKLEPLLEDNSICLPPQMQIPGQPQVAVQVRDVALCVILKLTDQQPADYGYTNARPAQPGTFQIQTMYRDTDAQRGESIAKWRKWREEHKDELKPAASSNPPAGAAKK